MSSISWLDVTETTSSGTTSGTYLDYVTLSGLDTSHKYLILMRANVEADSTEEIKLRVVYGSGTAVDSIELRYDPDTQQEATWMKVFTPSESSVKLQFCSAELVPDTVSVNRGGFLAIDLDDMTLNSDYWVDENSSVSMPASAANIVVDGDDDYLAIGWAAVSHVTSGNDPALRFIPTSGDVALAYVSGTSGSDLLGCSLMYSYSLSDGDDIDFRVDCTGGGTAEEAVLFVLRMSALDCVAESDDPFSPSDPSGTLTFEHTNGTPTLLLTSCALRHSGATIADTEIEVDGTPVYSNWAQEQSFFANQEWWWQVCWAEYDGATGTKSPTIDPTNHNNGPYAWSIFATNGAAADVTASTELPALTQSATGGTDSGAAAQTFPSLTQEGLGGGEAEQTFPSLQQSLIAGAIGQSTLPSVTQQAYSGSGSSVLPALTQSGTNVASGPAAQTFPSLQQSGGYNLAGTIATSLPSLTQGLYYEAEPAALSRDRELSSTMTIRYEWVLRNEMELSNPTDAQAIVRTLAMTTGTDTGEANQLYHSRFTLEAEEENEIDLVGQLYNPLGEIISFGRIKRLLVINEGIKDESTTPTSYTVDANEDIYVGGGGSSGLAWAGLFNGDQDVKARVRAGGVLCWQDPAGVVVLPGAAEKILFTGIGAGPVTVSLIIEGTQ